MNRLGIIETVVNAARSQPDKAAAKLADVLVELVKTVEVLDAEMVRYLSLHFDQGAQIAQGRAVLLQMEVGYSAIRINDARGHCHKIKHIHEAYLDKWFDNLVGQFTSERDQIRTIFNGLGTADDYMIGAMQEVSTWLETEASAGLDLVDAGDFLGANLRIHQARLVAKPARKQLITTAARLRSLQADFIDVSSIS